MNSLVKLGLVGAGVWAAFRAHGAHDMQVPLDMAFSNPFESLAVLNRRAWDAAHPMKTSTGAATIATAVLQSIPQGLVSSENIFKTTKPASSIILDYNRR
jgi:hypothetical protein